MGDCGIVSGYLWFWRQISAILRQLSRGNRFRFVLLSCLSDVSYSFEFGIIIFGYVVYVFRHLVLHSLGISSFWSSLIYRFSQG